MRDSEDVPGVIDPACAYTVGELAKRLRVTRDTVLSWKGLGLKLHGKAGGRVTLVIGADFIQWCTETYAKPHSRASDTVGRQAWLTTGEAAAYLDVPISTLETWRSRGRPSGPVPVFVKLSSKRIRYLKRDLDTFLLACRRETTVQPAE